METIASTSAPQRSRFVTTTAWVFIIIGALTTIASLIQGLMYVRMLTMPTLHQAMHEGASHLPLLLQLVFEHFRLYLLFIFSLSLSTLISAIGLLKRKELGRRLFIGVLAIAVITMLTTFITQLSISPVTDNIPAAQIPADAKTMMRAMKGFFFIITFSLTCLAGWLSLQLSAPEIKQEFNQKK
ncbi:MAG: hypothetical protein OEL55_03375 [Desulfobulbaceae bacterium]|nr:hypothetical protein [Desulfobulbaceae bacterium]